MRRACCLALLLCAALPAVPAAAADGALASWWLNADQRGERLLEAGDAATAARTFADPQRKAYAKIIAGDYQQAARELSAFDGSDAHYNRGNALAYAGKLAEALEAYDLALKRDPDNKDARHNRDLVASALKKQSPEKQGGAGSETNPQEGRNRDQRGNGQGEGAKGDSSPGSEQDRGGQAGKQAGKRTGDKDRGQEQASAREQRQPAKDNPSNKKSDRAAASPSATNAAPPGAGSGNEHTGPNRPARDLQAPGADRAEQGSAQEGPPADIRRTQAHTQAPRQKDDAEQARRDAAASLAPPPAAPGGAAGIDRDREGRGESPAMVRPSEQQLAQEQWLRSIPDDPGGLLRRKFLVEHLLRQQKSQP